MKTITFFLSIILLSFASMAQNVAINADGSDPDPSAILDVKNTNKGFLPPRMSTTQMNDITSPPAGLMIYNTTINSLAFFDGTEWKMMDRGTQEPLSYGGQTYQTKIIGFQCWMAENLNYETPHSLCHNNNPDNCDIYGRLYKWEPAQTACPAGWHLPSDDEWKTLEMYLGMSQSQADSTGWRGTNEGEKMKSTSGWHNNGNGAYTVGFKALPAGYAYTPNSFHGKGNDAIFWSATEHSGDIKYGRDLSHESDQIKRSWWDQGNYFSVRCVRD